MTADLPPGLACHYDRDARALIIRSGDVAAVLRDLLAWAGPKSLDLAAIEVGPPSLEDAYLTAIGELPGSNS